MVAQAQNIASGGGEAAPGSHALLSLAGIGKSFGPNQVLNSIDMRVSSGEIVGLLGENGAGKSTLMNIVSGGLRTDDGTFSLDGVEVEFSSVGEAIDAGIAFVHQELSVVEALSVAENLFLGRLPRTRLGTVDFREMRAEAAGMLTNIGATDIDPQRKAGSLRAGEQQLVEIAKAAARHPRLLILDEPTSSLTPHEVEGFKAYVRRAAKEGVAIIFITHRLEEALELCNRILVLRNGNIVAERTATDTSRDQLITDMTGKASLFEHKIRDVTSKEIAFHADGLSDGDSLREASFDVRKGEIFGLFGLVGAGRTELLELICGARRLQAGQMRLFGEPVRFSSPSESLEAGISLVPEGRKTAGILPQHSVRRNGSASSLRKFAVANIMSNAAEKSEMSRHSASLSIKMEDDLQAITTLSGGNQQKVVFARAFMAGPRLLLLDEPTHGVDVGAKAEIYDIVAAAANRGLTVIVASSEIPEITALCDRVAVLSKGKLVRIFDQGEINEQGLLESAFSEHEIQQEQ